MDELDMMQSQLIESMKWVATLDRSALGRFAVPERTLALLHGSEAVMSHPSMTRPISMTRTLHHSLREKLTSVAFVHSSMKSQLAESFDETLQVCVEYDYWTGAKTAGMFSTSRDSINVVRVRRNLNLILEHNEFYHDYFDFGIWDVKEIDRLMAEGVDPALAGKVMS